MNSSTCTSYSSTCTSFYYHTNLCVNLPRYCWKTTPLFTPSFLLYFVVFLSCWPARFNSKNGSEVLNSQVIWHVSDTSKSSLMLLHRVWQKKIHAESEQTGIFHRRNGLCDEIEWHHSFSRFSRVTKST